MGLSEGEGGGIVGECGVGTIVWVRRRNGSWWPGRILGQEELSASHLMSPRSGTPVKLLGREDASVDWYNLEKSKRVKAFRCGEFDACIERAEASRGIPIKKREKYARREDAILHALELEKQMLERKQQKLGSSSSNKFSAASKKEQNVGFPSGNHIQNNDSADHGRFVPKPQLLSRKVSSPSEASMVNPFYTQKGKGGKYSTWEDDTSEATPRMRGLQDFGLRSAQSKRKATATVSNESVHGPFLVDSHVHGIPVPVQGMEGATNVMSSKNGPSLKKRRTQGGVNEESLGKRRDRRRPLVQVLQSSAKLSASQSFLSTCSPIPQHMKEGNYQTLNLSKAGRSTEDNLPDDSNDCLDHTGYSSDQMQTSPILFRYPGNLVEENTSSGLNEVDESNSSGEDDSDEDADTEDDETLYTGIAQSLAPLSKNSGRYIEDDSLMSFADQERYGNLDGMDEPLLSGYMYQQNPHEQTVGTSADLGVSKWNMKGKRNIRNLTKRPMEGMDGMVGDIYHGSINGRSYDSKRRTLKSSRARTIGEGFYQKYDDFDENDFIEKDLDPQLSRYGNHRYSSMLKGSSRNHRDSGINDSDEDSPGMSPSGWEGDGLQHVTKRAYWETEGDHFDQFYAGHLGVGMESMWVDVDLKVQASYQGERVPLVSLMSRLNGKAIVGHPVQIETLDDGSTSALISRNDSGEDPAADGNETPPPVWRTARRTAMQRVPRPHPLPAALEGREADALLYSDPEMKPTFKKPYAVHFDNQAKLAKKTSHGHRPVMPLKFQKKASKKVSLTNQKTRKLSSIATQQKLGRVQAVDGKLTSKGGGSILDGLIKPASAVPMVTCVPVKVVFSRILEAVGRSPSTAVTHRSPMSGPSQKKPS